MECLLLRREVGTNWPSCCDGIVAVWMVTPTQSRPNLAGLLTSHSGDLVTVGGSHVWHYMS